MDQMISRRDLRHDSTIFFMSSDLRCHFTRKQLMAGIIAAQNRYCGLIARGFESEDCHKRTVGQARRLPNSATDAVAL